MKPDLLMALYPLGVWHQRRWAHHWRAYEVYVPSGSRVNGDTLIEALQTLWARMKRGPFWTLLSGEPRLIFRILAVPGQVRYLWLVPERLSGFVDVLLAAMYPEGALTEADDPGDPPGGDHRVAGVLRLTRHPAYALRPWSMAHAQAMQKAFGRLREGEALTIDYTLRAIPDSLWKPEAHREYRRAMQLDRSGNVVTRMQSGAGGGLLNALDTLILGAPAGNAAGGVARTDRPDRVEQAVVRETPDKLVWGHGFALEGRVLAGAQTRERAYGMLADLQAGFVHLDAGNRLYLERSYYLTPQVVYGMCQRRAPISHQGRILATTEIAHLVAVPAPIMAEGAARVIELRQPPPPQQPGDIHLVDGQYRGRRVPIYVGPKTLCDHMALMGRTGSGKGVLLLRWCMELAEAGYGFTSLWPLKRDARALMAALPETRRRDVIYWEVGHPTHVLPLNLLAHDGTIADMHQVVTEAMNIAYRLWSDSWGKSMERYLRMAFYGAAAMKGTIRHAIQILTDENARVGASALLPGGDITLEEVGRFLESDAFNPREIDPALNKLQELLLTPSIAPMVTATTTPPWQEWALGGKIIVGVLNQEELGDLPAALAAGATVSQLHRALMRIPTERRKLFPILYDEFRFQAGRSRDTWERAFKQLRQFLSPQIAALQDKEQFSGAAEGAFKALSGAGNAVVLANSAEHAEDACKLVGAGPSPVDITNLAKRSGYANLNLGDQPTGAVSVWAPEVAGSPYLKPLRDPDELINESMATYLTKLRAADASVGEPRERTRVIQDD